MYEMSVQSWFRSQQPGKPKGDHLLLAVDVNTGKIAAAAHVSLDDGMDHFIILALAASVEYKRQGLCSAILNHLMTLMGDMNESAGLDRKVVARIESNNLPSKEFFAKSGFVLLLEQDGLETWANDAVPALRSAP